MFYIDGISLKKIKEELYTTLHKKKINRISKNSEHSISIFFGKLELVFSCNPNFSVCYITEQKEKIADNNSSNNLIANMKKHLINASLEDISQLDFDRILIFKFSKLNELGEIKKYKIYFEIMGKHSNFIFTDEEDKIIDLLKRFSLEENRLRAIFPGLIYERPVIQEKISPESLTREEFYDYIKSKSNFLQNIEGVGKLFVENISDYDKFKNILNAPILPSIFYKNKRPILATVLEIFPKEKYDNQITFNTYNELINFYILNENLSSGYDSLLNILNTTINKRIKKIKKILVSLENEYLEKKDYDKYRSLGDILAASLYSVKKGMKSILCYDFYKNCEITIELDPLLSPKENLERLYKKYNKLKKGIEVNKERKKIIEDELNYLYSITVFIDNCTSLEALKEINEELILEGYIKQKKNIKKNKNNKDVKHGVFEGENFIILFGRNNIENENVSFKLAQKNDIWLHAKNTPGAHVIIKTNNITDDILLKAAKIAAYYTKANTGDKVSIDYTERKFLNKPKGHKPGFVTYTNERNIVVEKPENI